MLAGPRPLALAVRGGKEPYAGYSIAVDFVRSWYRNGSLLVRDQALLPGYTGSGDTISTSFTPADEDFIVWTTLDYLGAIGGTNDVPMAIYGASSHEIACYRASGDGGRLYLYVHPAGLNVSSGIVATTGVYTALVYRRGNAFGIAIKQPNGTITIGSPNTGGMPTVTRLDIGHSNNTQTANANVLGTFFRRGFSSDGDITRILQAA